MRWRAVSCAFSFQSSGVHACVWGLVDSFAVACNRGQSTTRGRSCGFWPLDGVQAAPTMLLMIDNYDSFTYNLVQYLGELGACVQVYRNDALTLSDIEGLRPQHIVISPGPCSPAEAGISVELIRQLGSRIPILGVCLGHQSIGQAFGGHVVHARQVMHGKISMIHHTGQGVFVGLPNPFEATRYHSLVIEKASLPDCLEMMAWTEHPEGSVDEIMGVRHRTFAIAGVQFHPESILTEHGYDLLKNFLRTEIRD